MRASHEQFAPEAQTFWRRLLDFGHRAYARLLFRKRAKNPNIYPLY